MDSANLQNEIKAYREVLQKGKLTEIDLDALGDCLTEADSTLGDLRASSEELRILRNDLIGEIVRLATASRSLKDGVIGADVESLSNNLRNLDATHLLSIRSKMRSAFANLQRKGDFPRRVICAAHKPDSIKDYKIDNARV